MCFFYQVWVASLRKGEELRKGPCLTAATEGTRELPCQPLPTEHGLLIMT
jgi:hypothetical protein